MNIYKSEHIADNLSMHERTKELHKLMADHQLKAKDVGALLSRAPVTVRIWRVQSDTSRAIPPDALELLKLKLAARAAA